LGGLGDLFDQRGGALVGHVVEDGEDADGGTIGWDLIALEPGPIGVVVEVVARFSPTCHVRGIDARTAGLARPAQEG